MALPPRLDEDTLPVVLQKQLGIQLKGDFLLHLLAGMPVPIPHQVVAATVTTAASTAGLSGADSTKITTALATKKASK